MAMFKSEVVSQDRVMVTMPPADFIGVGSELLFLSNQNSSCDRAIHSVGALDLESDFIL